MFVPRKTCNLRFARARRGISYTYKEEIFRRFHNILGDITPINGFSLVQDVPCAALKRVNDNFKHDLKLDECNGSNRHAQGKLHARSRRSCVRIHKPIVCAF